MALDADVLALFRCPKCHGALVRTSAPDGLGCATCRLLYPIEDDLPSFLVDEAQAWAPPPDEGRA